MNNNQFRRYLREKIESICKDRDMEVIYIDTTTSTRMYYLYNRNDLAFKGTLSIWTGNNECSLAYSTNKEKIVSLANKDASQHTTFVHLDKIVLAIEGMIRRIAHND